MINFNIIFVLLGLNPFFIFLNYRKWLLDKKSFNIIFIINFFLFILGFILSNYGQLKENFSMINALEAALMSQLIFLGVVTIFRKVCKRDPRDTFWATSFTKDGTSLVPDTVFNIIFFLFGFFVPIIVVLAFL